MHKILEEHKALLKSFMKIKEMSGKINSAGKKQKDGLIAVINETCYSLIKHAEFEDIHLFPLAGRIVDEELLSAIEKQMSRIVY
jgi:hemerythrin-like domain-containing protein